MSSGELPIIVRLKKQIEDLKRELNHDLPKALEEARAHGDLSENAEYDAAKDRQGLVRARINQMQARIRELSLFSLSSLPHGVAAYGSDVVLEDINSGEKRKFKLVFPEEADPAAGSISVSSPLGRALINKAEGDEIEVQTPSGKRSYELVKLITLPQAEQAKVEAE